MKVAQTALKQTKQTAAAVAKRVAQEQLETLKSAKQQLGIPTSETFPNMAEKAPQSAQTQQTYAESPEQMSARLQAESKRLLEKLESELLQIRQKKEYEQKVKIQQEQQAQVASVQQKQEIQKKESIFEKVKKRIKGRIAGKREQQKIVSG